MVRTCQTRQHSADIVRILTLAMNSGEGDVVQLTDHYLTLAQHVRPKLARHQLPNEVKALREIEDQLQDMKQALNLKDDLDNLTAHRT